MARALNADALTAVTSLADTATRQMNHVGTWRSGGEFRRLGVEMLEQVVEGLDEDRHAFPLQPVSDRREVDAQPRQRIHLRPGANHVVLECPGHRAVFPERLVDGWGHGIDGVRTDQ